MSNRYIILLIIILLLNSCTETSENKNLAGSWIEVMPSNPQIIQGVTLNKDGSAESIGMATLLYEKWQNENDKLILWGKSVGNGQTINFSDTLNIIKNTSDSLILGKYGMYRIYYYKVENIDEIKKFNVLDSLKSVEGLTELETRNYSGLISDSTINETLYTITIYNYKNCGDGVWKLTLKYPDRNVESFGRMYTLRGDAENINAVVYQMIPFSGSRDMFFLYLGDKLELLNQNLERSKTGFDNILSLQ